MTTATGGRTEDDEVLTTEVEGEPEPARPLMSPRTARIVFLSLAGVAGLALLAALLAVSFSGQLSLAAFRTWIYLALGVIVVVIIAEIVLLLLARPRKS